MKKRIAVFCSFALAAAVAVPFVLKANEVKGVSATGANEFTYNIGSSGLINQFATAFSSAKTADPEHFDPASVHLTTAHGEITYGVAHGNLYQGYPSGSTATFSPFDKFESSDLYSTEFEDEKSTHAYIHGTSWGNPYLYSGNYDGIIFWFTAHRDFVFSVAETAVAGSPNSISRIMYIKKANESTYTKVIVNPEAASDINKVEVKIANSGSSPAVESVEVSEGDTFYFELNRRWNSTGTIQSTSFPFVFSNTPFYNDAQDFTDDNMHMLDYTEEKGWCKDGEHHYYTTARDAFNDLSDGARKVFVDEDEFSAARERLVKWAAANGESFDSDNKLSLNQNLNFIGNGNGVSQMAILITASIVAISSIAALTFVSYKRKKHN